MRDASKKGRAVVTGLASVIAGGLAFATLGPVAASGPMEARDHSLVRDHKDEPGALTNAQRRVIREATAQYRDVDAAVADGYQPTDLCVEEPGLGGMGYHFVHPELAGDTAIDPALPDVLLYAHSPRGDLMLVGVEYLKNDADGDLGTDEDRPTLFGEPFNGPMEGHEPGQPVHYDIHAWVWKSNPSGELSDFNPRVSCP